MATTTAELQARISLKDDASKNVEGMGLSFGKLTAAIGLGTLAADAFRKASDFLIGSVKKSIADFGVQEQAVARLKQGMTNIETQYAKTAKGAEILKENNGDLNGIIQTVTDNLVAQASALQKTTTFGDEQIISAQAMLSTFMLNQHQIETLTPSILDMAAALQKTTGEQADLQQISILLGKALGGEDVAGLAGALRRVGVVMTETQTKILETGSMEDRLNTLTTIVSQNFGGFAAAAADTYTGKITQMQNAVSDVYETIGGFLAPIVAGLATKMKEFVTSDKFNDWMKDLERFVKQSWAALQQFGATLDLIFTDDLKATVQNVRDLFKQFGASLGPANDGLTTMEVLLSPIVGLAKVMLVTFNGIVESIKFIVAAKDKVQGVIGKFVDFTQNPFGLLPGRASGGPMDANQPYVVGENGPEIVIPSRGSTVVPNGVGGTVTVNFNNVSVRNDSDLQMIIDRVREETSRALKLANMGV